MMEKINKYPHRTSSIKYIVGDFSKKLHSNFTNSKEVLQNNDNRKTFYGLSFQLTQVVSVCIQFRSCTLRITVITIILYIQ